MPQNRFRAACPPENSLFEVRTLVQVQLSVLHAVVWLDFCTVAATARQLASIRFFFSTFFFFLFIFREIGREDAQRGVWHEAVRHASSSLLYGRNIVGKECSKVDLVSGERRNPTTRRLSFRCSPSSAAP